jgi:lipoprotein-anchoring transpeptidase ErfK/SrfK
MERVYYSKKYDNAPMPHAVFFRGGYAVHGTYSVGSLGRPASHGCVRLAPGNAATLFSLVSQYGTGNSRIVVTY